jgi:hypothetical protein
VYRQLREDQTCGVFRQRCSARWWGWVQSGHAPTQGPRLFAANPGLLTTDFKSLSMAVQPIFDEVSVMEDVGCLTREEMSKGWVFKGWWRRWRRG